MIEKFLFRSLLEYVKVYTYTYLRHGLEPVDGFSVLSNGLLLWGGDLVHGVEAELVELGGREDLDLLDVDVPDGVELLELLGDLALDRALVEAGEEVLHRALGGLGADGRRHPHAEGLGDGRLGAARALELAGGLGCEGDAEDSQGVAVEGLDVDEGLDKGHALAEELAESVPGHVEPVEVGEAVAVLDLLDAELELAVAVLLVLHEVGHVGDDDSSHEVVLSVALSAASCDKGLADISVGEVPGGCEGVPLLLEVGVDDLLGGLLALWCSLVLACRHSTGIEERLVGNKWHFALSIHS